MEGGQERSVVTEQPDLTVTVAYVPCCWWCSRHPTHLGDGMCWWWFSNQISPWWRCVLHVVGDAAGTQLTRVMACVGGDSATRAHHDGGVCGRLPKWHQNDGMCYELLVVIQWLALTTTMLLVTEQPDLTMSVACVASCWWWCRTQIAPRWLHVLAVRTEQPSLTMMMACVAWCWWQRRQIPP